MKLLLDERGSELVSEFWRGAPIRVTSQLAYPEARAALRQALVQKRLSRRQHQTACGDLDLLWGAITRVGLDDELAVAAGELADQYSLRGADAVHLATAIFVRSRDQRTLLATWDKRLAEAAFTSGFSIVRE